MVACELLDLFGLLVCDVGRLREVVVDEFLICLVDKRCEEQDGGRDETQAPEWNKLNQVVGDECTEERLKIG